MIASSRNYPFNSRVTTIHTVMFSCIVSTSKEGLFQKCSTMVLEMPPGMLEPRRAVAKIIYTKSLRPTDRLKLHDIISNSIDETGAVTTLGNALDIVSMFLKEQGLASEVINIAE